MALVSVVGRVWRCQSCWKSVVLMIFIVLPNFAVCSSAVSRGILISLSQLVQGQYVGIMCALALQPFPLPLGKKQGSFGQIPTVSQSIYLRTSFVVARVDESVSASRQVTLSNALYLATFWHSRFLPHLRSRIFMLEWVPLGKRSVVDSQQFLNDIHSLNLISPGCLEWGEINISIPSVVDHFSEICVYQHGKVSPTHLEQQNTSGQIPTQSFRVPTEDQNSYSTREMRVSPFCRITP